MLNSSSVFRGAKGSDSKNSVFIRLAYRSDHFADSTPSAATPRSDSAGSVEIPSPNLGEGLEVMLSTLHRLTRRAERGSAPAPRSLRPLGHLLLLRRSLYAIRQVLTR